jgi:hypothetical protein
MQDFFPSLAKSFNSGQTRSVILCGNVYDVFHTGDQYEPLIQHVCKRSAVSGVIQLVYELNGPIRFADEKQRDTLRNAWIAWKTGENDVNKLIVAEMKQKGPSQVKILTERFDQHLMDAIGNPTTALEFLRQLTICSRAALRGNLLIVIEAADMLLPAGDGDVVKLNDNQLRRIAVVQDWFSEPAFMKSGDSVILIAESRSLIHPRIARMPQVVSVEIKAPDTERRQHFIEHICKEQGKEATFDKGDGSKWNAAELSIVTAGLTLHAIRQLVVLALHSGQTLTVSNVVDKVEEFIKSQVGEDVVEFSKPTHKLSDVIGFKQLKEFCKKEVIPRVRAKGKAALAGAGVAGPIGGGKTYTFEAVASECGIPVLVLKNLRSMWFGQTDVIFERLRRVLEALEKILIFVDEADTQFGGVDANAHETEKRLTGKIQAMMSDSRLRGKVVWLLMTARIHLLSADIRRPGRAGDLIIPVLDPEGEDRTDFIRWMLSAIKIPREDLDTDIPKAMDSLFADIDKLLPKEFSAASFASLRSYLVAIQELEGVSSVPVKRIRDVISDNIPADIGDTREYQRLQALVNTTRKSLLPIAFQTGDIESRRKEWLKRIAELEMQGIK